MSPLANQSLMKTTLSRLEKVPLRDAWRHESGDFTPWLAESDNLMLLADAIGLSELECVAVEHQVGDFKLDMLCTDGNDQVIIENQLEKTNHTHLGQILAYAAGVDARKVIWIAESFRPEHAAALQFLNENTTEELSFFAVEVELWKIGDSPLAPKFEVVVKPNDWVKSGREQARAVTSSSTIKQLQMRFWLALIEHLNAAAPGIRPQKPRPQHWLNLSVGKAGFNLAVTANTRNERIGVELYFSGADSKKNFADMMTHKAVIEKDLGFELDWQELPDAKACRVASWYPDASLEDESRWVEYLAWVERRLVRMDQVLRPILRSLP
jgi:hypothetical protein